jgi:hypothetical protein
VKPSTVLPAKRQPWGATRSHRERPAPFQDWDAGRFVLLALTGVLKQINCAPAPITGTGIVSQGPAELLRVWPCRELRGRKALDGVPVETLTVLQPIND